jgi:E3 ubiquitin-protein ligase CCNP1IP1
LQVDQENLSRKNRELAQALREKGRKHLQTQELYDKLKRRAMLGQVQNAASDAVDHTIQASVSANRFVDKIDDQNQRHPAPPLFSAQQTAVPQQFGSDSGGGSNTAPLVVREAGGDGTRAGFSSQESIRRKSLHMHVRLNRINIFVRE